MISRTRTRQKNRVSGRIGANARKRSGHQGEMLALLDRHSTEMLEMVQQIEEARAHISAPRSALAPMFDELAHVVSEHIDNLEDWAEILRKQPAARTRGRQYQTN
jgi:hypothetical protein